VPKRKIGKPRDRGEERGQCPALLGTVSCPLRPKSMRFPSNEVPTVQNPPAADVAPACCTQATVALPGNVAAEYRQKHYWGSLDWVLSYGRRSTVERTFAHIKSRNTESVNHGWLQVAGLVRTSLMLAVAVASNNLRLVRLWQAQMGQSADPLLQPNPGVPRLARAQRGRGRRY
jgi:hypothetical protein